MFKKSLLALAFAAVTGSAFAAGPVANLKVNGTITPPTCTVNGEEQSADVLYEFNVSPGMFPASGNLKMAADSQNIKVVCDATTYLSFTASDERTGTELVAGANNFGLGKHGDDNVGFYNVVMKNAKVKANEAATEVSVGVQSGSNYATTGTLNKTMNFSWASAAGAYSSGQIFSADFEVTPTLNSVLKNSDGTAQLDGHAVLAFAFGV